MDRSLPKEELRKRNEIRESLEMVKEEYMGVREEMMREAEERKAKEEKEKKEKERGGENSTSLPKLGPNR